jgi:diguanylate cyclase (GGDEF)-like protein/PAS domain S-box-containing protein
VSSARQDAALLADRLAVPRRRARLSSRLMLLWFLPIIGLPIAGGFGIQALNAGVSSRQVAAADLQNLEADVNLATVYAGWAIALHWPATEAVGLLERSDATARADLKPLNTEPAAAQVMVAVGPAVDTYLRTLDLGAALFIPGAAPVDPASESAALAQFDRLHVLIDEGTAALTSQAGATAGAVRAALWILVIGESTLLVAVLWALSQRRRRLAMSQTRERVLEDSERTFRLLFEENPLPTLISDPETGRFLAVNKAAQAQYQYSAGQFASMTETDVMAGERRATPRATIQPVGSAPAQLTSHRVRSGERFDAEVSQAQLEYRGRVAVLTVVRDVTAQRQLEAKLRTSATHDFLTGLPNRRLFIERFDQAQAARGRHDDGLAIVCVDMDGFKAVNDTHGHGIGDDVLRVVAQRLRSLVRAQDTVARFSGDQFVLLIDGASVAALTELANRLVRWLGHPYDIIDTKLAVSVTLGISMIQDPTTSVDEALRTADLAMYAAKESGRAAYRMYDPEMRSAILERLLMARQLQQALDRGEFSLSYQPIVSRNGDRWEVHQLEALIRWNQPERGLVSPADFIPVAEHTGSIVAIGAWVLRSACEQIAAWQRSDRRVGVHGNVSGRQLKEADFVPLVMRVVAETGIDPSDLILELTETAMLDDLRAAQKPLNDLRAMGIRIALDDFGTGYSSLTYLGQLPIDIVKIDRSFVANLDHPDKLMMLATIMRLMETLRVVVIAEGVETSEELTHVLELGIDAVQGFYFSRPVAAASLPAAIQACEACAVPKVISSGRAVSLRHPAQRGRRTA